MSLRKSDIIASKIPFLSIGHLGFYPDRLIMRFDSVSNSAADSLLVAYEYFDFRNLHPNRPLPNHPFDSVSDSFVGSGNNHYLLSDMISLDIIAHYYLFSRNRTYGPCVWIGNSSRSPFSFLAFFTVFSCPIVDIWCRIILRFVQSPSPIFLLFLTSMVDFLAHCFLFLLVAPQYPLSSFSRLLTLSQDPYLQSGKFHSPSSLQYSR